MTVDRRPAYNSTYKKLAVQWLNEVQFFNQTFVQIDSFVLRNRQLLIAAKRCKTRRSSLRLLKQEYFEENAKLSITSAYFL